MINLRLARVGRGLVGLGVAGLVLAGCGGDDDSGGSSAAAAPPTAEPADNNAACRLSGDTITQAEIPSVGGLEPTRVRQMVIWDDADYAARVLEILPADGQVADDIEAVRQAMVGIAEWPANDFQGWADYRDPLTAAVTALQSSCQDAGVVDILNQS
ncbi:hypothetical protein [Blastococcus mobilis]|uniref:Lipoprotein n=1 Tax=Blastococcus mobilis TaxID=1938746 RepID=A0A239AU62_9ACTN|nr:hypothetical protein [Blastococcus mobilis]SNR98584.1 hypothetical protein SAMN06272737_1564 [Blastococcus mobilis]